MSEKTLIGIRKIEFLPIAELTLYPNKIITPGETISAIGNWQNFNQYGLSSCTTQSEQTENGIVFKTQINGVLIQMDNWDMITQLLTSYNVYRIKDIYNTLYLVGTNQKPTPEVSFTHVNDSDNTGKRLIEFEITWSATLPPTLITLL